MRRSASGFTFRWAMVNDESDSDSDWDDTLPDLPECDLCGAAVILEFKEKKHLILM